MSPSSLSNALLFAADGTRTERHLMLKSTDWDEIKAATDNVYMPFRARPTGTTTPDSDHYTFDIGGFTLSRFRYGTAVRITDFDADPGRGIALTTVAGVARHAGAVSTLKGESYLVDVSRCRYEYEADDHHLQLNLSFPRSLLSEMYERWHGVPADPAMWRLNFGFGGPGSSWLSLLEYSVRCIAEMPDQVAKGALGLHLEEMLGLHLLTQWSCRFDDPALDRADRGMGPLYVTRAEEYMREHARRAPTLTEVAAAGGVSVRALTNAFRKYRDQPPIARLREIRMQGARADLLAAPVGTTVASVVSSWGYVNHGVFSQSYRKRFGESPSATLGRVRAGH